VQEAVHMEVVCAGNSTIAFNILPFLLGSFKLIERMSWFEFCLIQSEKRLKSRKKVITHIPKIEEFKNIFYIVAYFPKEI
jgi:hypothetical protein